MKKIKLLIGTLLFSFISTSSQGQILSLMKKNPEATLIGGAVGSLYLSSTMHKARDLSFHLDKVFPYFKKKPEDYNPIKDYVLNALAHPANKADYDRYKKLAGVMGISTGIPPYAPIKVNKPTVLINPALPQDPKAHILVNPAHPEINLNPADPRTHYDFTKDIKPDVPKHTTTPIEEQNWQDYILQKNANNVRELERNMRRLYGDKPYWYAAHHIVAWDDPRALNSRILLNNEGIDFNDAENGVYLPQRDNARTVQNGIKDQAALHPTIHTDLYYKEIENRLNKFVGDPIGMKQELKNIASELKQNKFPH